MVIAKPVNVNPLHPTSSPEPGGGVDLRAWRSLQPEFDSIDCIKSIELFKNI